MSEMYFLVNELVLLFLWVVTDRNMAAVEYFNEFISIAKSI